MPSGYMPMRLKPRQRRSRSLEQPKKLDLSRFQRTRSESPRPRQLSDHSFTDDNNRERIKWPRIGEMHIFLHADRFFQATSSRHCDNLQRVLLSETLPCSRRVVVLVTDGGSDWNGNCLLNILNYGKLWKRLRLDALLLIRYAPRHSKYNMIERRWAPLTKKLSQVRFINMYIINFLFIILTKMLKI